MKFFITDVKAKAIDIRMRAESEDGEIVGDAYETITPGMSFRGLSFEALSKLGVGEHNLIEEQE